ncbi:MAG: ExbD/TolR family protein [Gammaproteobacteria bacterium]
MNAPPITPPARRVRTIDDQLIPLINIIFLLLVFFLVAGQIAPQQEVEVEPPTSRSSSDLPQEARRLVLTRDGQLRLDDRPLAAADLASVLGPSSSEPPITLAADHEVRAAALAPVLAALRQAGFSRVTLYTRHVEQP